MKDLAIIKCICDCNPKCGETTLLDGFNSFQFISLSLIWIYFAVVWFNLELHWDGDKGREKGDKTSAVVGCTKCYQDQIQWAGNEIIISVPVPFDLFLI